MDSKLAAILARRRAAAEADEDGNSDKPANTEPNERGGLPDTAPSSKAKVNKAGGLDSASRRTKLLEAVDNAVLDARAEQERQLVNAAELARAGLGLPAQKGGGKLPEANRIGKGVWDKSMSMVSGSTDLSSQSSSVSSAGIDTRSVYSLMKDAGKSKRKDGKPRHDSQKPHNALASMQAARTAQPARRGKAGGSTVTTWVTEQLVAAHAPGEAVHGEAVAAGAPMESDVIDDRSIFVMLEDEQQPKRRASHDALASMAQSLLSHSQAREGIDTRSIFDRYAALPCVIVIVEQIDRLMHMID